MSENLGWQTFVIAASALFALFGWLLQRYIIRERTSHTLFLDIISHRSDLAFLEQFFTNARKVIEKGEIYKFYYEKTDLSFYNQMIPQMIFMKKEDISRVKEFYDYYNKYEHEIIGFCDSMKIWEKLIKEEKQIDRKQIVTVLYNIERVNTLRKLLVENTTGKNLHSFSYNYHVKLVEWDKSYRAKLSVDDTQLLEY